MRRGQATIIISAPIIESQMPHITSQSLSIDSFSVNSQNKRNQQMTYPLLSFFSPLSGTSLWVSFHAIMFEYMLSLYHFSSISIKINVTCYEYTLSLSYCSDGWTYIRMHCSVLYDVIIPWVINFLLNCNPRDCMCVWPTNKEKCMKALEKILFFWWRYQDSIIHFHNLSRIWPLWSYTHLPLVPAVMVEAKDATTQ